MDGILPWVERVVSEYLIRLPGVGRVVDAGLALGSEYSGLFAFVLKAGLVVAFCLGPFIALVYLIAEGPRVLRELLIWLGLATAFPRIVFDVWRSPVTRKNHALEHATIQVLYESAMTPDMLDGVTLDQTGFLLSGTPLHLVPDDETESALLSAAQWAQKRLVNGERRLAYSPLCGTTQLTVKLLPGVVFVIAAVLTHGHFWPVWMAVMLATYLGHPLGMLVQRLTVDPDVKDLVIRGVEPVHGGEFVLVRTGPGMVKAVPSWMRTWRPRMESRSPLAR